MTEPRSPFVDPGWMPRVPDGMRILIAGASGGLGSALADMLVAGSDCVIGAHGNSSAYDAKGAENVIALHSALESEADCMSLVDDFCDAAGGIDALVALNGRLHFADHWKDQPEADWRGDIDANLNMPFFLARAAMAKMTAQGAGGRIVLNGTESALHGGSAQSFAYAIAKRGTECMVEGLAREGAAASVLVNGVRFGYIASGFHQRWSGRSAEDMEKRRELVPLKRGGDPAEAAALMIYLLSGWSSYITGQMFALTGGDWL